MLRKIFPENALKEKIIPNSTLTINVLDESVEPLYKVVKHVGYGSVGRVSAVMLDKTDEMCAIKRIWSAGKNHQMKIICREIEIMSKLSSDSVVKFYGAWLEKEEFIIILMELCLADLEYVLGRKPSAFNRDPNSPMNKQEYFISLDIIHQIVQGVSYLHDNTPPIIHRDLKPTNVLIQKEFNGWKLKLCDFALAKVYDSKLTQGVGTSTYMAPEVEDGGQYDEKCDVYSIARIATRVIGYVGRHNLSVTPQDFADGSEISVKMKMFINILEKSLEYDFNQRPSCTQILNEMEMCSIDHTLLGVDDVEDIKDIFYKYICEKITADEKIEIKKNKVEDIISKDRIEEFIQGTIEQSKHGSYGRVVPAKNKLTNEIFAIKKIYRGTLTQINREVDILSQIKSEFIVKFFESWKGDNIHYIRMELCDMDLKDYIKVNQNDFYLKDLNIAENLLNAVNFIHNLNPPLVHRDIKPENILLKDNIKVKLCDFGHSKFFDNDDFENSTKRGTELYRAPEIDTGTYNIKCDVYSTAIVLLQIFGYDIEEISKEIEKNKTSKKNAM